MENQTRASSLLSTLEQHAEASIGRSNYLRQAQALALGLQLGFQNAAAYYRSRGEYRLPSVPTIYTFEEPSGSRRLPLFDVVSTPEQPVVLLNETGWWQIARELMMEQEAAPEARAPIEMQYQLSTVPWTKIRALPEDVAYLMGIRTFDYMARLQQGEVLPPYEGCDSWLPVAARLMSARGDTQLSQEINQAWRLSLEANSSPAEPGE